ncbi:hypothetical protein GCM10027184_43070 [Saccharothrix stipae]
MATLPVLAGTAGADEPVAAVKFHAEAGAFPVDDRQATWSTPEQEVRIREQSVEGGALVIDGEGDGRDHVRIQLAGPGDAPLRVGTYTDVRQRPTATNPGLLVIADGLACYPVHGSFTVHSIERDPGTGRLTGVDVELEHRCGAPDAPAFVAHATLSS